MQLRDYRKLVDMTLAAVAEAVGLANAGSVARHEDGRRYPDAAQIERYRVWSKDAITERDWHEVRLERERKRDSGAAARPATEVPQNA